MWQHASVRIAQASCFFVWDVLAHGSFGLSEVVESRSTLIVWLTKGRMKLASVTCVLDALSQVSVWYKSMWRNDARSGPARLLGEDSCLEDQYRIRHSCDHVLGPPGQRRLRYRAGHHHPSPSMEQCMR